ncbi:hypothetical protein FOBRF1_005854 [Fusarium oxysporum]
MVPIQGFAVLSKLSIEFLRLIHQSSDHGAFSYLSRFPRSSLHLPDVCPPSPRPFFLRFPHWFVAQTLKRHEISQKLSNVLRMDDVRFELPYLVLLSDDTFALSLSSMSFFGVDGETSSTDNLQLCSVAVDDGSG